MGYKERTLALTNDKKQLLTRLRRVEGQVRGIQQMIADDRYCIEILTQIAATRAALYNIGLNLLENHARHCLVDALSEEQGVETGQNQSADTHDRIDELIAALARFAR